MKFTPEKSVLNTPALTAVLTTDTSDLGADVAVTFTATASGMGTSTGQVIFNK